MAIDLFGVIADSQFWKDMGKNARNLPANVYASLDRYGKIPGRADAIAEELFPGSARDSSTKNSFRHALGTGMLTQELGGGPVGAGLAKGAGYLWEALGASGWGDPKVRADTLHDLNANALGARKAMSTNNQAELVKALHDMAIQGVPANPPGIFERSPGYLTRTVR